MHRALDARTRRYVLGAVAEMLVAGSKHITIDVHDLRVGDSEGANAFVHIHRVMRDAGARVEWRGPGAAHLRRREPSRSSA